MRTPEEIAEHIGTQFWMDGENSAHLRGLIAAAIRKAREAALQEAADAVERAWDRSYAECVFALIDKEPTP